MSHFMYYLVFFRLLSVGHLLQQLNAMSVEPSETIQEEDKIVTLSTQPLIMENVKNVAETFEQADCTKEENKECVCSDQAIDQSTDTSDTCSKHVFKDFSDIIGNENVSNDSHFKKSEDEFEVREDAVMEADSDEELTNVRHGIKRSHESENNEESVEKVKSAYQLMGFMFNLENTKKIRKASVWYKKRFSQIRFQNRILRLQKLPKHIYFDEDEVSNEVSQIRNATSDESQALNEQGELFLDTENTTKHLKSEVLDQSSIDIEEFSEKDDSTDEDQDIFFSAEEDILVDGNKDRRENKGKHIPKRKKKRQLKKKYTINYPEEMIENPKIKKFWRRRYSLFSKFDEGIKMDAESWYSVTPEKIAVNIAERCQCDLVVDAFCGAGGNAIQLAFTCEQVIAVDIDPHKIELARNNARVYGVEDRIEFVVGDYLQLAPSLAADVVFLSPPWGGPSYTKQAVFPLSSLQPVGGQELFKVTSAITENIAFYLPKNINTQELVECAGPGGSVEIVQNFLDRELVAVTAYFGELVNEVE